jgi:hypothetical protein
MNAGNVVDGTFGTQLYTGIENVTTGGGNDSITGTSGDNVLVGGAGNDTLSGGGGNDNLYGGDGNDSLVGGAGNDTLYGGAGSDSLFGGADMDAFVVTDDHQSEAIFGGSDGIDYDQIWFANFASTNGVVASFTASEAGSYTFGTGLASGTFSDIEGISGTAYGDFLDASASSVAQDLFGNAGHDILFGGSGNDRIFGGDGIDLIAGGAGNDQITTGTGADTVVLDDGFGSDIVTDFDMTLVSGRTVDQLNVADLTNATGAPVTWRDVVVTDTVGNGSGDAILTFPGGERITLQGVSPAQVNSMQGMAAIGIPCFVGGTQILTPLGLRPVEGLRMGDLVSTDALPLPILWAGARQLGLADLHQTPALRPVHFDAGAVGNNRPLRLSPQHAVRLAGADGAPVLVRAKHLAEAGVPGVRIAKGVRSVRYHHLLLVCHAIVFADGATVESMYPGRMALAAFSPAARLAIAAAIAGQRGATGQGSCIDLADLSGLYGPRCLPLLGRKEALRLCRSGLGARHRRHKLQAATRPGQTALTEPRLRMCRAAS